MRKERLLELLVAKDDDEIQPEDRQCGALQPFVAAPLAATSWRRVEASWMPCAPKLIGVDHAELADRLDDCRVPAEIDLSARTSWYNTILQIWYS